MSRPRARSVSTGAGLALAVAAATVSTLPAATAAEPGVPQGLAATSPNSTTTMLSWERDTSAARYTVQVDNDELFATPEFNQVTANVSAVPHTALKSGTNHWRVQTISASGAKSDWTTASFERADPLIPRLVSPSDGAPLTQPDEPPLLQWSEVPGAKSYSVEIDDAADFIGSKKFTTATTSAVPSTPLAPGTWFWRVTATDADGQVSVPADAASFTVRALAAPELVSPTDSPNEEVEDVVLDWAPVPGASHYQLQVSLNSGFEASSLITNITNIKGTRFSPPNGYNNDQYFWRVRAIDAAGAPSEWAASPYNFKRHWPDRPWPVTPVQPGFPEYPADFDTSDPGHQNHPFYSDYVKNHSPADFDIATTTERSPFLQWTPVQHASHYELQLSTNAGFVSTNTKTCAIAGTTFTPTNGSFPNAALDHQCGVKEGTTYFWRVRAMDKPFTVAGIYSPAQKFVWEPAWYSSITPATGATVDTPTLSWKSRIAASQFHIEITNNIGNRVARGTTRAESWTPPDELKASESPFEWSLTAITADGSSSLIVKRSFSISEPTTSSPAPAPLTALTGIESDAPTMRAPRMSWTPHPDADHYRVMFGSADASAYYVPAGDESFGDKLHYPTLTDTGARIMNPGRYKWIVQAFSPDGSLLDTSATNIVRIAGFDEVVGQRVAVDGLALAEGGGCADPIDAVNNASTCPEVPTTPVLAWEPQDGVAFYGVYVSNDQNFTNLTERTIPASTGTMYAYDMLTLPDNTSGVPYYWHIRPCKAVGICGPDPVSSATGLAKNAFKKVSPLVETNATPPVVSTNEVTFHWKDYYETNQSHLVTRDGTPSWSARYHEAPGAGDAINPKDLSNQSASRYRIRVSTDATFTKIIDDQTVDQTTYTSTTKLYPEGPLYWRVSALDVNNNELSSSEPRPFSKSSTPLVTTLPAPNGQVSGTVPFRWEAEAFTGEYEIEVSRNDRLFSSVNRLFTAKVWTTAYTWNRPIPVSSDPYYWRARRVDSSGNLTAWSEGVPFHVVSDSVTLTSPAPNSIQDPNGSTLIWEPLNGAATYLVEIKDRTGKIVESRITPGTAYSPFATLAPGTHTWSVTPRDNDAKTLAAPSSRTFEVDGALVAQSSATIGHDTERPQVGSVLSVAPLVWNRSGVVETYQWLRDGSTIRGATTHEYIATLSDFDKSITVRVTGTLPSYVTQAVISDEVRIGPGGAVIASAPPQINGSPAVGQRLSTTPGSWPAKTKLTYQWLRNGSPITGATGASHTLTLTDAVTRISVRVTGTLPGMSDGSSTSATVSVPKAKSTSSMTLSSTKVKRGAKVTLSGTVTVPSVSGPTGTVVIKRGAKRLKSFTLTVSKGGRVSFVLPKKLKKGKHRLQLVYNGTSKIAPSRSKVMVLRLT